MSKTKNKKGGMSPREKARRQAQSEAAKPQVRSAKDMLKGFTEDIFNMMQQKSHLSMVINMRLKAAVEFMEQHPFAHNQMRIDSYKEAQALLTAVDSDITNLAGLVGKLEDLPSYEEKMMCMAENMDKLISVINSINDVMNKVSSSDRLFQNDIAHAMLANGDPDYYVTLPVQDGLDLCVPKEIRCDKNASAEVGVYFRGEGVTPDVEFTSSSRIFVVPPEEGGEAVFSTGVKVTAQPDVQAANDDFTGIHIMHIDSDKPLDITVSFKDKDGNVQSSLISIVEYKKPEPVDAAAPAQAEAAQDTPQVFTGDLPPSPGEGMEGRTGDAEIPVDAETGQAVIASSQQD